MVANSATGRGPRYVRRSVQFSFRNELIDRCVIVYFCLTAYLWFWGIIYLIVTTLIAVLKREEPPEPPATDKLLPNTKAIDLTQLSVIDNYKLSWNILNISHVQLLIVLMFTVHFQWGAYEGVGTFKFLNTGVSNDIMIPLIAFTALPMRFLAVFTAAKLIRGGKPIQGYINFIPYRSLFCLTGAIIVWLTPQTFSPDGTAPNYIYFVYLVNEIGFFFCIHVMRIIMNASFMRIADPAVGATYMTMLNTIENLGGIWPISFLLWIVEFITWRDCGSSPNLAPGSNGTQVCD